MKQIQILFLFMVICMSAVSQNSGGEAAQIKQQMSAIRKSTNWSDPVAAKEANAKIEALSAKLTQALRKNSQSQQPVQQGGAEISSDEATKNEMKKEMDDYSSKLWNQMMKIVREGEGADILLAKPVREEIKEDYRNDEAEGLNPAMLSECTTLILDFSVPITQTLVSQMELFKSIKTLIIIGVESLVPVDLNYILNKAKNYPLYELYIVGFDASMKRIPENIMLFRELNTLVLYGNQISAIPSSLIQLKNLKILNINFNPVQTIEPLSDLVKNLEELSIKETGISQTEVAVLKQKFPNCKIQAE